MAALISKISALPRAARWALIALVGIVVYFVVIEPVLGAINTANSRGDASEAALDRFEQGGQAVKDAGENWALGVRRFGEVDYPGSPDSRPLEFDRAVDAVLKKHNIVGHTSTTKNAPMGAGPLVSNAGADKRVERVIKTLDLTADPEVVGAVIADLEATPVVSTVSSITLRQPDARDKTTRAISASITLEAWTIAKKDKGR